MNVREKFSLIADYYCKSHHDIFLPAVDGMLKISMRPMWGDGLMGVANVRILNIVLGLSTAPRSWEHLIQVLELSGITETIFERALDDRLQLMVIYSNTVILNLKHKLGSEKVDKWIDQSNTSFNYLKDAAQSFRPTRPHLTVYEGGME